MYSIVAFVYLLTIFAAVIAKWTWQKGYQTHLAGHRNNVGQLTVGRYEKASLRVEHCKRHAQQTNRSLAWTTAFVSIVFSNFFSWNFFNSETVSLEYAANTTNIQFCLYIRPILNSGVFRISEWAVGNLLWLWEARDDTAIETGMGRKRH